MHPHTARPHLFGLVAGIVLAASLSFVSVVLARTWIHLRESQVIVVTGSARKNIRSDLVVWTARLLVEDRTIAGAYAQFQRDLSTAQRFLAARGQRDFMLAPMQVRDLARRKARAVAEDEPTERAGYQLSQSFQITSTEVEAIPRLAADCLGLLADGVIIETESIQFISTQAGQTKVQMMADATEDARRRAEEIAGRGGRRVRELRAARMGVVQINPMHSTATTWDGNNDTSSLDKTITTTVSAEFSLK